MKRVLPPSQDICVSGFGGARGSAARVDRAVAAAAGHEAEIVESFVLRAYTNLDLGAAYRWDRYHFRLHVHNALDDADYLQQAGGRVSGTGLSTAPGRNVKFSVTVRF